ncbi:MAG: amidase [Anaerolineae bacterium]
MTELTRLTIEHLAPRLATGEVSPTEVTQAYLDRIAAHDPELNAYIRVTPESALAEAQAAEKDIRRGAYRGPLHGIPIALKDLFDVAGVPTTAASAFFMDNVPSEDAPSVARLRAAGAVILGKLNIHEMAYGVSGDSSAFGPTRNPWDPTRMPGGSSGGSGAAVAARLCAAATGSDTGGSIRIPSALCGVVGLKPTYGRVSNRGVLPLSYSLDHVGPMARSVYDVAVVLQAMSGYDAADPASVDRPVPSFTADLNRGVRGLTVALDPGYSLAGATREVLNGLHETLDTLARLGARIVEVSLPRLADANRAALDLLNAEASALHEERLKTQLDRFQPDVGARLQLGFKVSGLDVARALRVRTELMVDFRRVFETADAFIAPGCAVPAPPIGASEVDIDGQTVGAREAIARYTRPFNLAGLPALSIPSGFTSEGLPVGVQLVGAWWEEATLLRIGRALEGTRPWPTPD